MALFALVPYFILRKVTNPIENLMTWAKKLNKQQLTQPAPDFHYSELNSLAEIVKSSLKSVQESLEREQQFLGYASHELRTPIAITRTNTELLRKMIEKNISTEKQLQVLDRIERASLNMTNLTETLLWLNRQTDKTVPLSTISLGQLTQQLLNDLHYLLNGKKVQIQIQTDQTEQQLPAVLCRIIINNLLRNALQHTNEGKIIITQSAHQLIIHNQDLSENMLENDLGFGLGLELIERLVKHYEWQYKNVAKDNGHYVEINFV
ncbi:sensor histidine kinase [Psychromonas sp. KJ10-2]